MQRTVDLYGGTSTSNVHGSQAAKAREKPPVTSDQRLQDVELGGPSASAECLTILSNRDSAAHRRQPCSPAAPACRAAQLGRVLSRSSVAIVEGVHSGLNRFDRRLLRLVPIVSHPHAALCAPGTLRKGSMSESRAVRPTSERWLGGASLVGLDSIRTLRTVRAACTEPVVRVESS
jgi:hypothetical protein